MDRFTSARGLTFPELIVTVAIFGIASAIALATVGTIVPAVRTDGEVNRLQGLLQFAREHSIAQRRDVVIRFPTDATVTLARIAPDGAETPVMDLAFEYGVRFIQFEGQGDTPEGYGANEAVDFGGVTTLLFTADGMLIDETSAPINGTIFLGMPGQVPTARALAITGSTARARVYRWAGQWVSR